MSKSVLFEEKDNICLITLNEEDTRNAISPEIINELALHKAKNPDFNIEKVHFFPLGGIKQVSQFIKEF